MKIPGEPMIGSAGPGLNRGERMRRSLNVKRKSLSGALITWRDVAAEVEVDRENRRELCILWWARLDALSQGLYG